MASVVEASSFSGVSMLGFENHLNVFHDKKRGLPKALAYGLTAFFSTTAIDDHFRRFNGHTQVNATDLKLLRYPTRDVLMIFGEWFADQLEPSQSMIDEKFQNLTA